MGEPIRNISTQGWAEFCSRHELDLAVLFGSLASGSDTPRSDVDLALLSARATSDLDYREAVWEDLLRWLGRGDVDVIWLHEATPLMGYRIATTGRLLFEARHGLFRGFVLRALKRHWDARKFYDLREESLRRVIRRYRYAR